MIANAWKEFKQADGFTQLLVVWVVLSVMSTLSCIVRNICGN